MATPTALAENRFALALSAGGVRAMAHLGVLRVMSRYGLEPDLVVGTSGGAIVAALYAAGIPLDELVDFALSWTNRKRALIDVNWRGVLEVVLRLGPLEGLVKGNRLQAIIAAYLRGANTFVPPSARRGTKRKALFLTSVDLDDGEPIVFCNPADVAAPRDAATGECDGYRVCGRLTVAHAVRASISIPGIFVPAGCLADCPERSRCQKSSAGKREGGHDRFVDGGVREFLPLAVAVHLARAGQVLGVNLGYAGMRREDVAERGLFEILNQSLDIMGYDQFEGDLSDELIAGARVAVLNPMIYDVGTFDVEHIPMLIERGEQAAERFFLSRGLVAGGDPAVNRRRLFPLSPGSVLFPPKDSEDYQQWKQKMRSARTAETARCGRKRKVESKPRSL